MGPLLIMVRKDLLRRRRSPLAYLVALSFPLLFSLLLALAFGRGEATPRVHLLVENRDEGVLGQLLLNAFQSEQLSTYFEVEIVGEEGRARMEAGDASALLVIPAEFSEHYLAGEQTALQLVRNPAQNILPYAAEEAGTVLTEMLSSASRVLREPLQEFSRLLDEESQPTELQVVGLSASVYQAIRQAEGYLIPPVIKMEVTTGAPAAGTQQRSRGFASVFLWVLPGISVFALFQIGDLAMRDLIEEGTAGTLRRQLAGPVSTRTVVLAKAMYAGVLTSGSLVILAVLGWSVSPEGASLPGFLVLSAALVVAVAGLASIVYGIAGSQNRGSTLGTLLYLGMAMIGGSFFQLESLPASLRRFSPLSLFYWGNTGYRTLLRDGGGVVDILPQAGVLVGVGTILLLSGAMLLHRKVQRGAGA